MHNTAHSPTLPNPSSLPPPPIPSPLSPLSPSRIPSWTEVRVLECTQNESIFWTNRVTRDNTHTHTHTHPPPPIMCTHNKREIKGEICNEKAHHHKVDLCSIPLSCKRTTQQHIYLYYPVHTYLLICWGGGGGGAWDVISCNLDIILTVNHSHNINKWK